MHRLSYVNRWTLLRAAAVVLAVASLQGCLPFVYGERFEGSKGRLQFKDAETGKPIEEVLVVSLRSRGLTALAGPDGPVGASEAAYIDRAFVYRSGSEFPSLPAIRSAGIMLGPATASYLEQLVAIAPGFAPERLSFDAREAGWTFNLRRLPAAKRAESLQGWRDLLMQSAVPREQLEGQLAYSISTTEESMQGKELWSRVKVGLSKAERQAVETFVEEGLRQL